MDVSKNFEAMPVGWTLAEAFAEANRCLLCHDPPCSKGCPGNTDPGTFIRKLRLHNVKGAIRTIKENNILGGACGVLCPTAELCERECAASGIDRPIRIGKIQRALVEHAWTIGFSPLSAAEANGKKVAVVGSGPAGLSCAAELAKAGYGVTVFEQRARFGGVLGYGVPSYRFSPGFVAKEIDDLRALGVELKASSPIEGDSAAEALLNDGYDAVFLATGCWDAMRLGVDGDDAEGVLTATDFLADLKDAAEGGYDALEALVAGKDVVVLGGGSVAMDCVGSAVRLGARDAYLAYRRSYTQMPAEEEELLDALHDGAHFLLLNQPVGYTKDEAGRVSGVRLVRTRLGEPDDSGRRRPELIDGSEWTLDAQVVIEAIGSKPVAGAACAYPSVELTPKGLVVADGITRATNVPGVYAGGDIVRGPALVIKAVQDGKLAAAAIIDHLSESEEGR